MGAPPESDEPATETATETKPPPAPATETKPQAPPADVPVDDVLTEMSER
jgi:hypothetical protein